MQHERLRQPSKGCSASRQATGGLGRNGERANGRIGEWWGEAPEQPKSFCEAIDFQEPQNYSLGLCSRRAVAQHCVTARHVYRPY